MTDEPKAVDRQPRAARVQRGLAATVAVLLVVEVVIAVAALFGSRPARFGWQMYSGVPEIPRVVAISNAAESEVDVNDWLVSSRFEIDFTDLARSRGCELTGADSLRIEVGASAEEVRCR